MSGGFTETPVIAIENAGGQPYKTSFAGETNPAGAKTDVFRFSTKGSDFGWNRDGTKGSALARIYFDHGFNNNLRTEYYDPRFLADTGGTVIRQYRYTDPSIANRAAPVALELMRPDEGPNGTPTVLDSIFISDLEACFDTERDSTWQFAEQSLNAGCSTGSSLQYSWRPDASGSFSPFSSSPVFDLPGYSSPGAHAVSLRIKNTTDTTFASKTITVLENSNDVVGPTCVSDKLTKTYSAALNSLWYERYPPTPAWGLMLSPATSSYNRIWPAGNDTVDVRADSSTTNVLRRGQARVVITTGNCGIDPTIAQAIINASTDDDWGFFGGGPTISWNSGQRSEMVRFYDLAGGHDPQGPFARASWFHDPSTASVNERNASVEWGKTALAIENTRAFEFSVIPGMTNGPYVFSFAWDPDLGVPEDDQSGWDNSRSMTYVTSGSTAVGMLLFADANSDVNGVTQYGLAKRPPALANETHAAHRAAGARLLPGPRDVQFIVTSRPRTGPQAWTVIFVRGTTLTDIQQRADEVLDSLTS